MNPEFKGSSTQPLMEISPVVENGEIVDVPTWRFIGEKQAGGKTFVKLEQNGIHRWFDQRMTADGPLLVEALSITDPGGGGQLLYNGEPR